MGYYSDVAIRCEAKAYERFKKIVDSQEYYKPSDILHDSDTDDYILHWNYIKWYSTDEAVQLFDKLMDELDNEHIENDGLAYSFMRLGEDNGDVEERENDYGMDLYYIRRIDIPEDWETIA